LAFGRSVNSDKNREKNPTQNFVGKKLKFQKSTVPKMGRNVQKPGFLIDFKKPGFPNERPDPNLADRKPPWILKLG